MRTDSGPSGASDERYSDRAYDLLRDRLVRMHYKPMQPLNERELTVELGLGLAPIREALRRLEGEKLVVIYPRRGIFAAEIGLRDQQSIKEVRMEIEGLAASLAALRATPAERDALCKIAEQLALEEDSARQMAGDAAVHQIIYQMTRNTFLQATLVQHFNLALRLWYFCSLNAQAPEPEHVDHRALANAVKGGDSEGARALLRDHVLRDSDRVRALLFNVVG